MTANDRICFCSVCRCQDVLISGIGHMMPVFGSAVTRIVAQFASGAFLHAVFW